MVVAVGVTTVHSNATGRQVGAGPMRLSAFAVNMSNIGAGATAQVSIVIDRWSPDAVRENLVNIVTEKGPDSLLDALKKLPAVGRISTPGNLGYDLRYARKSPFGDGGTKIVLVTDRPIGGWEAVNHPRTLDYPFTLIQIQIPSSGVGEGKLSVATKVSYDKHDRAIELETYASEPIRLEKVRVEDFGGQ
jgi:hypothetical protein